MIFFSQTGKFPLDNGEGEPDWILFGIPYDSTSCFNTGARFGPDSIRKASYHLEVFDCDLEVDVSDINVNDRGNINVRLGDPQANCDIIKKAVSEIEQRFIGLGGEHTISYPLVCVSQPDVCVCLDAHLDLRDTYLGEPLSHACTLKRVYDICDIHIYGYRECSKEEYTFVKEHNIAAYKPSELENAVFPENKRVHLSIDLDVLDPCAAPNVSNPVPNGLQFAEATNIITQVVKKNTIVSMDMCEVCSRYADRTAVTAASLLYKTLAVWRKFHGHR